MKSKLKKINSVNRFGQDQKKYDWKLLFKIKFLSIMTGQAIAMVLQPDCVKHFYIYPSFDKREALYNRMGGLAEVNFLSFL